MKKQYYYLYKIVNLINGKYYYGVHSTNNLNDKYMGSGKLIKQAIKKYGIQNFRKEILEYFDNVYDMYKREGEVVTEQMIQCPDCYNFKLGGKGGLGGVVNVRYNGQVLTVPVTDENYINGKYQHIARGNVVVRTEDGTCKVIHKTDKEYIAGNFVGTTVGKMPARDNQGNVIEVSVDDERLKTGELVHVTKGMVNVWCNGEIVKMSVDDPRYISGECVNLMKGTLNVYDNVEHKMKKIDTELYYLEPTRYIPWSRNRVTVYDSQGNALSVTKDEFEKHKNVKYFAVSKNTVNCANIDGVVRKISRDSVEFINGVFKPLSRCKMNVKHKYTGEICRLFKWDKRLLSGDYYMSMICRLHKPSRTKVMYEDEYNKIKDTCEVKIIRKRKYTEFSEI